MRLTNVSTTNYTLLEEWTLQCSETDPPSAVVSYVGGSMATLAAGYAAMPRRLR